MKTLISLITALLLISIQAISQQARLPIKEIQPIAQNALKTFIQLVKEENYRQMGFETLEEVRSATLGIPIQDFMIRLDILKKYTPSSKPDELLMETDQVYFPLLVKDQVKSSIIILKTNDKWQTVSFGGPNFIKLISSTLTESSRTTGLDNSSYFLVRIPSLNLFFLGFHSNEGLMLVPLIDDIRFDLKKGVSIKAEKVFSTILPEAMAHDGLPR